MQTFLDLLPGNTLTRLIFFPAVACLPLLFFPKGSARGVKVYDEFVEGAKEAFPVILKIIPFLVTMLVAIAMPAEGPSFGVAPSGTWTWMSRFSNKVGLMPKVAERLRT